VCAGLFGNAAYNTRAHTCLNLNPSFFPLVFWQVHTIVEFDQKKWLAAYIEKNTKMRRAAWCKFEKDFYKLMNNR